MPEVPKIVHQRLRAAEGAAAPGHPDANVLTAFVEQSLSASEREGVLAHLSLCDECRELLAVRSPDLEFVPVAAASAAREISEVRKPLPRRAWFAWNRLGWAGLAAGIAIAAAVVLATHPTKTTPDEALKKALPATAPAPSQSPGAAAPVADARTGAPLPSSDIETKAKVETRAENRPAAAFDVMRRDGAKQKASPAELKGEAPAVNRLAAAKPPAANPLAVNPGFANKDAKVNRTLEVPPHLGASETVTVNTESPAVAAAQPTDTLTANQAAPVMRAKAARIADAPTPSTVGGRAYQTKAAVTQEAAKQDAGAAAAGQLSSPKEAESTQLIGRNVAELAVLAQPAAHWTTRGDKLQESLDSGAHWKTVFHSPRKLLSVSEAGADVWAGGKRGDLFHSADSGTSWTQIHPSINGQMLNDDITHIDVYDALRVVLSTTKNESWSTADGGATWQKK